MEAGEPAPFPWDPPTCPKFDGSLPEGYESLFSIDIAKMKHEDHLNEKMVSLSPDQDLLEVGARITAALKQDVKPSWIFYVMAGNYWRIVGSSENSRNCYLNALSKVPERFKDVVLTNLAGLIYRLVNWQRYFTILIVRHCTFKPVAKEEMTNMSKEVVRFFQNSILSRVFDVL